MPKFNMDEIPESSKNYGYESNFVLQIVKGKPNIVVYNMHKKSRDMFSLYE